MNIFYKTTMPAALLFLSLTAVPIGAEEQPATCTELMNERCTVCHYMTRVCQNLGNKSERKWKKTVKTMMRRGAKLNKAEMNTLVDCLAGPAEEAEKTCREYLSRDK